MKKRSVFQEWNNSVKAEQDVKFEVMDLVSSEGAGNGIIVEIYKDDAIFRCRKNNG